MELVVFIAVTLWLHRFSLGLSVLGSFVSIAFRKRDVGAHGWSIGSASLFVWGLESTLGKVLLSLHHWPRMNQSFWEAILMQLVALLCIVGLREVSRPTRPSRRSRVRLAIPICVAAVVLDWIFLGTIAAFSNN